MFRRLWKGPERRAHPRFEAALDLSIQVEMYGFAGDCDPFFASGTTLNVSRGGVFASVDAPVAEGSVCKIFFRDAGAQVRPSHAAGRVLRCSEEDGLFYIAVQFDEPLLELTPERPAMSSAEAGTL